MQIELNQHGAKILKELLKLEVSSLQSQIRSNYERIDKIKDCHFDRDTFERMTYEAYSYISMWNMRVNEIEDILNQLN